MKKSLVLLLGLLMLFALSGCGNGASSVKTNVQPAGVNGVLEEGMKKEDAKTESSQQAADSVSDKSVIERQDDAGKAPESETVSNGDKAAGGIDVDLTTLSSTMVYSEVYNMLAAPKDYIGKTVKMDGKFALYHDEVTDKYYFACIIADATACCSQGIEFVLTDDYAYPDDYPEEGGDICVAGVFDTYLEGDNTFCTLRNAKLL